MHGRLIVIVRGNADWARKLRLDSKKPHDKVQAIQAIQPNTRAHSQLHILSLWEPAAKTSFELAKASDAADATLQIQVVSGIEKAASGGAGAVKFITPYAFQWGEGSCPALLAYLRRKGHKVELQ